MSDDGARQQPARARPPDGRAGAEAVPFSLDDVLARVSDAVEWAAQQKGLELVVHRSRDIPPMLVGDPMRLGQVLLHLAENAVDFTAAGEVSVAVEWDRIDAAKGEVILRFSVTDTGIGLSDRIAALFQLFKAGQTVREAHGLLVVKELVQSMGGAMEVVSAPGIGTDFSFKARFGVAPLTTGVGAPHYDGLRVLVVDDNDTARDALQHLLEDAGCHVVAASDGAEAIAALHAAAVAFQLVIVDAQMPAMDGLETIRCVYRDPQLPHPPVIAMVTALSHNDVAARARRMAIPVDAYLLKPVKPTGLYRTVSEVVATRAATAVAAAGDAIDMPGALARLGGKPELLARLLEDFCATEADAARQVEKLIAAGQLEQASRLVHTAKGTAMILGLHRFTVVAAQLDRALRQEDRPAAAALLAPFARELAAAVDACARQCPACRAIPAHAIAAPGMPAPGVLRPLLDLLTAMLRRNSMASLEPAQRLEALLRGTRHCDAAAEISACLHRLDFATARRRVDLLVEDLAHPPG